MLRSSDIDSISVFPAVLVFKDDTHYVYRRDSNEPAATQINASDGELDDPFVSELSLLREWVNHERFPNVVQITSGNFHQVLRIKKYIVMAVMEEDKVGRMSKAMIE